MSDALYIIWPIRGQQKSIYSKVKCIISKFRKSFKIKFRLIKCGQVLYYNLVQVIRNETDIQRSSPSVITGCLYFSTALM